MFSARAPTGSAAGLPADSVAAPASPLAPPDAPPASPIAPGDAPDSRTRSSEIISCSSNMAAWTIMPCSEREPSLAFG